MDIMDKSGIAHLWITLKSLQKGDAHEKCPKIENLKIWKLTVLRAFTVYMRQ